MRVTALGHAGLEVNTARATVLLDPWLSPFGAFQASWFQYPDNSHLYGQDRLSPTAVVLSHEHLDHLDRWFLSQLPPRCPVIVPSYPSPVLRRKLEACGREEIVEAAPWEWVDLADGVRVLYVAEDSPMNHDAGIVLVGDGATLLDLNDARLSPSQLRRIRTLVGGHVDLLTAQAAGASWHPMCYEFADERKRVLSSQKRVAKLSYLARVIRAVEPAVAVPFAGPPCFLDPELRAHNAEMDGGIFPDQQQAVAWLRERRTKDVEVLLPGDSWDTVAAAKEPDPTWRGVDLSADRQDYLDAYALDRAANIAQVLAAHPEPATSLWPSFRRYFEDLLLLSPYFNGRVDMRVGFDVGGSGGGQWSVDFRPGHEGVHDDLDGCEYIYRFDGRWLPPILGGDVLWEDFFLSLRFSAWREPDVHNEHLLGVLKFAEAEAFDAVELYETTIGAAEHIVVHAEGRAYSVQRLCPHAGADLLDTSEVLPGRILRCLNHYYEFDLETGRCLNGACPALEVRPVEDKDLATS